MRTEKIVQYSSKHEKLFSVYALLTYPKNLVNYCSYFTFTALSITHSLKMARLNGNMYIKENQVESGVLRVKNILPSHRRWHSDRHFIL